MDRVFDKKSTVADLLAILFATGQALGDSGFRSELETAVDELKEAIGSHSSEDQRRGVALRVTDKLRRLVADELRRDEIENPKRRDCR
jgi:hypothetical protein